MESCIFCKIVAGEIPSARVFENEDMIIIKDINPQAKCHYLLIPKTHYKDIGEMSAQNPELVARCLKSLSEQADKLGLQNGYRLVTNKGEDGRQSVAHIHIHILGVEKLSERMA